MFILFPRRETNRQGGHPWTAARKTGMRLGRLAATLAAVTGAVLASAAAVPAAFASVTPDQGALYRAAGPARTPVDAARAVTGSGTPGWQIALIALVAALIATAASVLLDRLAAARRTASAPTADANWSGET